MNNKYNLSNQYHGVYCVKKIVSYIAPPFIIMNVKPKTFWYNLYWHLTTTVPSATLTYVIYFPFKGITNRIKIYYLLRLYHVTLLLMQVRRFRNISAVLRKCYLSSALMYVEECIARTKNSNKMPRTDNVSCMFKSFFIDLDGLSSIDEPNTWCEGGWLVGQLVPEAVSAAHEAHLCGDDASKCGSHHGPGQGPLRNPAAPQVDVVGMASN